MHAINERIAQAWRARRGRELSPIARLSIAGALLVVSHVPCRPLRPRDADRRGYRALAYVFLAVYVLPLLTFGVWRLWKGHEPAASPAVA